MQPPGGARAKTCCLCGSDCSNRPRTKDPRGRYYCRDCYERAERAQIAHKSGRFGAAGRKARQRKTASAPGEARPKPTGVTINDNRPGAKELDPVWRFPGTESSALTTAPPRPSLFLWMLVVFAAMAAIFAIGKLLDVTQEPWFGPSVLFGTGGVLGTGLGILLIVRRKGWVCALWSGSRVRRLHYVTGSAAVARGLVSVLLGLACLLLMVLALLGYISWETLKGWMDK